MAGIMLGGLCSHGASMFNLAGKVALVTGGNGGIGLGMARGLAKAGAKVLVVGRDEGKSKAATQALQAEGLAQGALHILVNNAGTSVRKPAQEMSLAEWRHVMDVNLTSAFLCSKAAHGALKRQGGKVINIGSMLSIFGAPYAPSYGASKGAIVQFTRSIATAWAADRIQCNAVLPGWIDTDLTRGARAQVPGLNERVLARTPAGRWGVPADLAGIAVFLASPASDFVTGTAIPVDGGYSIA
jgi:2-deoxy-D-gluconate 3-dehydrogenase